MKKHDEGYTLPYVLVILMILYFVVVAVLSSAEATVTAQQKSIAQMKQKYAAQGKIEMLVGQLCDANAYAPLSGVTDETEDEAVKEKIEEQLYNKINATSNDCAITFVTTPVEENGVVVIPAPVLEKKSATTFAYSFTVISAHNSIKITSNLVVEVTLAKDVDDNYIIVPAYPIAYNSYQIGGDAS